MHICGIQKNAADEPILLGRIVDTDRERTCGTVSRRDILLTPWIPSASVCIPGDHWRHLRIWLSYQVSEKNIFFLIILKEIVNIHPRKQQSQDYNWNGFVFCFEKKKKLCKCMCSIFSMIYKGIFIIIQET